jgi:hypothetical protein
MLLKRGFSKVSQDHHVGPLSMHQTTAATRPPHFGLRQCTFNAVRQTRSSNHAEFGNSLFSYTTRAFLDMISVACSIEKWYVATGRRTEISSLQYRNIEPAQAPPVNNIVV